MLRSEISMDDMTAVRQAVERLLAGAIGPLLDLLADDVELEVAEGGELAGNHTDLGKRAVADYFSGLGGLTAFWQMDYTATGEQMIAWGKERFTIEGCGLEGACEFALVFEIDDGTISRLLVIEDLRSHMRRAGSRAPARGRAAPSVAWPEPTGNVSTFATDWEAKPVAVR